MNAVENFGQIQRMEKAEAVEKKLYNLIGEEVDEAFDRNVQAQLMNPEMIARMGDKLNIVYTPLHGSGNLPVRRNLAKAGFKNVFIVKEQELRILLFLLWITPIRRTRRCSHWRGSWRLR